MSEEEARAARAAAHAQLAADESTAGEREVGREGGCSWGARKQQACRRRAHCACPGRALPALRPASRRARSATRACCPRWTNWRRRGAATRWVCAGARGRSPGLAARRAAPCLLPRCLPCYPPLRGLAPAPCLSPTWQVSEDLCPDAARLASASIEARGGAGAGRASGRAEGQGPELWSVLQAERRTPPVHSPPRSTHPSPTTHTLNLNRRPRRRLRSTRSATPSTSWARAPRRRSSSRAATAGCGAWPGWAAQGGGGCSGQAAGTAAHPLPFPARLQLHAALCSERCPPAARPGGGGAPDDGSGRPAPAPGARGRRLAYPPLGPWGCGGLVAEGVCMQRGAGRAALL